MPPGRGSAWLRALRRKGEVAEILPNLWPIGVFLLVAGAVALARYRETLD